LRPLARLPPLNARPEDGAGAAVANAVHDALAPWGVHIASQPYTPEKILQALGRVGPRA
jgi:hypothetical protein